VQGRVRDRHARRRRLSSPRCPAQSTAWHRGAGGGGLPAAPGPGLGVGSCRVRG
jgi:hypothetical protein